LSIKDYSQVKRVNGTKQQYGGKYSISCLIFSTKDGTQLAKVEKIAGIPYQGDFKIKHSEEIIGIYGYEDTHTINQLGFLIWTPPKL
jgi:hypothetical protein